MAKSLEKPPRRKTAMQPVLQPLSLYIHFPWCIKKCPYCDFHSQTQKGELPEIAYREALIQDLQETTKKSQETRPINSIFMGGGTPSLFSGQSITWLINEIQKILPFAPDIEITLEANPGTTEQTKFVEFQEGGVNRLSIGVQSFQDLFLKQIGRVHSAKEAFDAIETAQKAGFDNLNVDLMYGLPTQTPETAINDLKQAIAQGVSHISWYQLTLEPNTPFAKSPPPLPEEETLWAIQQTGENTLKQNHFTQYEISAWTNNQVCRHNHNYWTFGDYIGIGAGAHSKQTNPKDGTIMRSKRTKQAKAYMAKDRPFIEHSWPVPPETQIFEYFLNRFRLITPPTQKEFTIATGLPINTIAPTLQLAIEKQLLEDLPNGIKPTPLGRRFLNDLTGLFLTKSKHHD